MRFGVMRSTTACGLASGQVAKARKPAPRAAEDASSSASFSNEGIGGGCGGGMGAGAGGRRALVNVTHSPCTEDEG